MFVAGASSCASVITKEQRDKGLLYRLQSDIFETEISIAVTIVENIFNQNLATIKQPPHIKD